MESKWVGRVGLQGGGRYACFRVPLSLLPFQPKAFRLLSVEEAGGRVKLVVELLE